MPGHQAVRRARKASVGQQRHGVTQSGAHQSRGDRQHLAHARPALRPFITNHQYITLLNLVAIDGRERRFFGIKDPRRPAERFEIVPRNLNHTAFRRKIAFQNHQAARGLQRRIQLADHFLPRRFFGGAGFFANGPPADGEGFAAEQSGFNQALRDQCSTACCV